MGWDKTVAQKDAVKAFLVAVDGKFDLEASLEKFRGVAIQTIAKQTADQELIGTCMSQLFEQHKGATLNVDFIRSHTRQLMVAREPALNDPKLFSMLGDRVEEYLHDNCDQPAKEAKGDKPAVEAITGRTYVKKMGKGGGFQRASDQTAD